MAWSRQVPGVYSLKLTGALAPLAGEVNKDNNNQDLEFKNAGVISPMVPLPNGWCVVLLTCC